MKEGWKEVRLGEVIQYRKEQGNWSDFPFVGLENIESNTGKILSTGDSNCIQSSSFHFCKGDVLYGRLRPYLKKVWCADFEGCCSTEIYPIITKGVTPRYLYYWLLDEETTAKINDTNTGCRMPRANMNLVLDFSFPLPPLPEQQRIVSVLDSAFAKIEQIKHNAEKALLDAQDVFKNTLDDMIKMKEGWEEKRLKDIGKIITGQTPSTMNKEYYGGDIPFVKPADINIDGNGSINLETECLTEEGCAKSRFVERDSVLMVCIGGTIGKTGFTSKHKIAFNQQINAITDIKNNVMKFIYYCMISSDFQSKVISGGKSAQATLPIINKSKWENLSIPLPPLPEQLRIVSVLDDLSVKCKQLESNYQRIMADCEEMKQAILTRAMNGEL